MATFLKAVLFEQFPEPIGVIQSGASSPCSIGDKPKFKRRFLVMKRWTLAVACLVLGGLIGAVVATTTLQGQSTTSPVVPKELTSYRDIVKQALPAVVKVEFKAKAVAKKTGQSDPRRRQRMDAIPPGMPEELFKRFFEGLDGFEMDPEEMPGRYSVGTGFIVDPKGIVVTNNHVVSRADRVEVTLQDGRKFVSTDIKGDRKNDLAIVRFKTDSPLPSLQFADSDAMEIGDRVLAIGSPFGLDGSVSAGIISAKGRGGLDPTHSVFEDYLQTDAAINPGNSGGPLVNLEGKVVGINTAIKTGTGGSQGVGLAIASNVAKRVTDQLIRDGVVHRAYIGVSVKALEAEAAKELGIPLNGGVEVTKVYPGSPAGKAGMKQGDIITSVEGKKISDARSLQQIVGTSSLKKPIAVAVVRDGASKTLSVALEEQPENFGLAERRVRSTQSPEKDTEGISVEKVGLVLADLDQDMATRFGIKAEQGVIIAKVEAGGAAQTAGLVPGLLILKIDKKGVTSAVEAKKLLETLAPKKNVLLQVEIPDNRAFGTAAGSVQYFVLKKDGDGE
jgi:serine protease Do